MAQQDNPYLTITLTGRPPVKVKKDDWPIIASAKSKDYDNQYEFQANRKAEWKLTVRQHPDGRTIVYGVWSYDTNWSGEDCGDIRGGELVTVSGADTESVGETEPIVAAIQRVGAELEGRLPEGRYGQGVFPQLIHACIADLPVVEL